MTGVGNMFIIENMREEALSALLYLITKQIDVCFIFIFYTMAVMFEYENNMGREVALHSTLLGITKQSELASSFSSSPRVYLLGQYSVKCYPGG